MVRIISSNISLSLQKNLPAKKVKRYLHNFADKKYDSGEKGYSTGHYKFADNSFLNQVKRFLLFRSNIKWQEKVAKSLGVKADYSANISFTYFMNPAKSAMIYSRSKRLAKITNEALKDLLNKGYKLPSKVITHHFVFCLPIYQKAIGIFIPSINPKAIFLNPSGPEWSVCSKKWLKGVVAHEVSHYLHYKENPDFFSQLRANELDNDLIEKIWDEIISKVNKKQIRFAEHAVSNPCELVAFVFEEKFKGKDFSDQILKQYKKYKGPRLPN